MNIDDLILKDYRNIISFNLYRFCQSRNIKTIEELSQLTIEQLFSGRRMGRKTISYAEELLKKQRLEFKE